MGIPKLLKILSDVTTRKPLSTYRGKRAGVDGYTWLHRSLYCIGDGILQNPIDISRCINFFIKKLQLLLKNQITPIIIFDGDKLPMKNTEEDKRETRRNYFLKASEDLLKLNNKAKSEMEVMQANVNEWYQEYLNSKHPYPLNHWYEND